MASESEPGAEAPFLVLIVDDDPVQCRLSEAHVARAGGRAVVAGNLGAARAVLARSRPALVILDLGLPDGHGLDLLRDIRQAGRSLPVIVQTAQGRLDGAVAAMRAGASDFLVKPVSPDKARAAIRAAAKSPQVPSEGSSGEDVLAPGAAMRPVLQAAERVARSDLPVLLLGETGVGKEWLARRIWSAGARSARPFVPVNCGAIPRDLVEGILFGFERGAFTGAERRSVGRFGEADGGTLFLDEVGELSPEAQVKLLRALQDGEIDPVGAARPVRVDVRVMAATHRDLSADVAGGRFRADLFYRLHVFPIEIPPLRARHEEIAVLAARLLSRLQPGAGLSPGALARLSRHDWPGNIRELENALRRALVMSETGALRADDFHLADGWTRDDASVAATPHERGEEPFPTLAEAERAHVLEALRRSAGQPSQAARLLGIGRTTLYRKLRGYGLADGAEDP